MGGWGGVAVADDTNTAPNVLPRNQPIRRRDVNTGRTALPFQLTGGEPSAQWRSNGNTHSTPVLTTWLTQPRPWECVNNGSGESAWVCVERKTERERDCEGECVCVCVFWEAVFVCVCVCVCVSYDKGRPICGPFQTVQHHLHVVIGLCGVPALQCIVMRHVFV